LEGIGKYNIGKYILKREANNKSE